MPECDDGNGDSNNNIRQDSGNNDADYVEGLGRVLTGVNEALSRDIVSSTMAHLLICQDGSRFTFSHQFNNFTSYSD